MLDITPMFIRSVCTCKMLSHAELFNMLGLSEYFTISYYYKIIKGVKPVSDNFKSILSNKINEALTTEELIKVMKLQDFLK